MWRYPHVIRLRGFWKSDPAESGDKAAACERRYRRRFGAPTGLDYHEQVWLVCEELIVPATVILNGETLGQSDPATQSFQCDVTTKLRPRNDLCLAFIDRLPPGFATALTANDPSVSPARSTRLEIRSTAAPP